VAHPLLYGGTRDSSCCAETITTSRHVVGWDVLEGTESDVAHMTATENQTRKVTMNRISQVSMALAGAALLVGAAGCSDDTDLGTDPGGETTALLSVSPQGGSTNVDPGSAVSVEFSGPLQNGMEMYAALHRGDVTGPEVDGTWTWNGDHTRLGFSPTGPLMPETQYTLHVGGGMMDQAGHEIDLETHGQQMGGDWATDDMMMGGGMMGGGPHMGEGWEHSNGSFGMVFGFRTTPGATAFVSVVPVGGDTDVDPNAPVVIQFDHAMQTGMEMYAALHEGDVTGPEVAGTWTWSDDDTVLTFTPDQPLLRGTQYTVHLGGGMTDAHGGFVDLESHGSDMGGDWATDDMMMGGGMMGGGMMDGGPHMGEGWEHSNGSFGMVFSFTTAA